MLKYKMQLGFARGRVHSCMSRVVVTSAGPIEFIDEGDGPPVLLAHGIVGGCDQGPMVAQSYFGNGYRIIAVSRFGYLRSPLPEDPSPAKQADLYAALLAELGIEKAIMFGFSSGSSSSLQFAIRHPDRCAALILMSPAMQGNKVPVAPVRFAMQKFFSSDLAFLFAMKYFRRFVLRMMGVPYLVESRLTPAQTIWLSVLMRSFLPASYRTSGIMNDICVSNPDLNNDYPVEKIACPVMFIHAVDDPLTDYNKSLVMSWKMKDAEVVQIDSGGHLLMGYHGKARNRIKGFITKHYASELAALSEMEHVS